MVACALVELEAAQPAIEEHDAEQSLLLFERLTVGPADALSQVVVKPGTTTPHTNFDANVYILSKDEGGRHTPFFNNYRPQFYFRTTDVTGAIELPKDKEMVMPGDNVSITVKLINPIAMEEGLRFAIREGGKTVGSGVVAKIME